MRNILLLALSVLFATAPPAAAAPKASVWERWTAHDENSTLRLDHAPWDKFLQKYVVVGSSGINLINYAQVTKKDQAALNRYVQYLEISPVSKFNRDEQLAYWVNLYNALTIKLILDHYPVASIRDIDISPGLFSKGPWKKKLVNVEGENLSLDDVEHRILRPIWKDPRIHYAVNCASIGCPNLQPQAFTSENANELLEKGAREYVNHPRGVRISNGKLVASSIYSWFAEDFGDDDPEVIEHLKKYAEPALQERLKGFDKISDHEYDWSLNEAK